MSPLIWEYIGFIVAALILIWAVIELGKRFSRASRALDRQSSSWNKLDIRRPRTRVRTREESLFGEDIDPVDSEMAPEHEHHSRAQQNGHYSQSKKLL